MNLKETIRVVNEAIERSKKLTTKDRKKLKSSTFCGPNRSFPVPDCAHVRAAKVYLNKSKFSSATKKRIAACINRKAKALGCPGTKPAKAKGAEDRINNDTQKIMDSEIFEYTRKLVDESIEKEDMDLNFDTNS